MQACPLPLQFWHRARTFLLGAARKPSRWFVVPFLTLAAALAAPLPAQADPPKEMLFLSTTETESAGKTNTANAQSAFQAQAVVEGLTFIDGSGLLSGAAPLPITEDTKLIVIVTGYNLINPVPMAELQNVIETDPNLAVVIFSESCSSTVMGGGLSPTCASSQQNLQGFMEAVNAIQPQPPEWPEIKPSTGTTANYTARLNMSSLYKSTFSDAGLSTLVAGNYTPLTNVPLNYALYTQTALPSPPPAIVTQNVVGLFIPQTASNSGQGACLFLTADASEFTNNHPEQFAPIARAFTTAALDPNGACAQPVAGAPDLWAELSEPEGLTTATPTAITLTVGNSELPGVTASTDGQVDVILPVGLILVGSPPAGCGAPTPASPSGTSFSCPLSAMDPGDTVSFEFQVEAPSPITTPVCLSAEVSGVTGEINLSNNTATLKKIVTSDNSPDLAVQLTGDTLLSTGAPSEMMLTVSNSSDAGITRSAPGSVEVTLPGNLQLYSAPPAGCTATASGFTCPVPPLEPGESAPPFEFQVVAPAPILASTSITAEVTVFGDVNLSNNTDTLPDISTIDSPNLVVTLSGPSNLPIGSATTMTAIVGNSNKPGVIPSPAGTLEVTLPPGIELVSPPAGCTANAANTGFTCNVPPLGIGESAPPFEFQVVAPAPVTNVPIEAEVTWLVKGNTASDKTQKNVSAALAGPATPVPTLAELGLALLALMVAGGAAAGLRRKG